MRALRRHTWSRALWAGAALLHTWLSKRAGGGCCGQASMLLAWCTLLSGTAARTAVSCYVMERERRQGGSGWAGVQERGGRGGWAGDTGQMGGQVIQGRWVGRRGGRVGGHLGQGEEEGQVGRRGQFGAAQASNLIEVVSIEQSRSTLLDW
eukprot:364700-Chlamydomonas_euryale.AAC.12